MTAKSFPGARNSQIKRGWSFTVWSFTQGRMLRRKLEAHQEKVSSSESNKIEKVLERRKSCTFKLEQWS